jgi:gamma-glutamyltranspeptidase/glutathione hydrolase
MRLLWLLAPVGWLVLAAFMGAPAQDRSQGRSVVMTRYGIVAAESPLAAQAGAIILSEGGTAVDAAVAANAVMGVVAPMMNGLGGDLFALVYDAREAKYYGLNASGWAPRGLTVEHLKRKGFQSMPRRGIDTVTVPGVVDGWTKLLQRFGKKTLAEVLAPAIHYAEQGFPVPEMTAAAWAEAVPFLQSQPWAARLYLPNGRAPQPGEIFRNPELARSLRLLAQQGRDGFYRGEIAMRILELSRRLGGTMEPSDLEEFSSEWVEPLSVTYRGWHVYELPPNGQGMAALEMLNLMEQFPLARYGAGSVDALHVMIEAKKLAYADLARYVGDPRFSRIPVAALLSKPYAAARARAIDLTQANCSPQAGTLPADAGETTYLAVVDRAGNMVSLIQSNFDEFGSGLVPEGTGFVLQNRGALFNLTPDSPNVLAGHKRPLHTIIPAFLERPPLRIAFGIMGGFNQAQAHAQFVANLVDFGMNLQAALEAPRFSKRTFEGCDVDVEDRFPEAVRNALAARGHRLRVRGAFSSYMGGGQAVAHNDATGVNYGASDPRKDGAAIPEPAPLRQPL